MEEQPTIDILNDLALPEDGETIQDLDLRGFFTVSETTAVSHNASRVWNDMRSGKAKPIRLAQKRILRTTPLHKDHSGDLYDPKDYVPSMLSFFTHRRIYRPNPIMAINPLPILPKNTVDARRPWDLIHPRLYPDIYTLPLPFSRRLEKAMRKTRKKLWKSRKKILATGSITLAISASIVILSVSAKNYVEHETVRQYNRLQSIKNVSSGEEFKTETEEIRNSFGLVSLVFSPFDLLFNNALYSHPSVRLASQVIDGGKSLSDALVRLRILSEELKKELWLESLNLTSLQKKNLKLTDFLRAHKSELSGIDQDLSHAIAYYAKIESLGNPTLDAALEKNLSALIGTKEMLGFFLENFDPLMEMLGDTKPQKYLILNQNRDELRANGGFPGSALFIELYKWRVQKFEKRDIYDYDWKLYPYKETPPEWLRNFTTNFGLRDANYYPDFRESTEKINFFFEKAGWATLDTVVVINQGIIIDLLRKYGPVKIQSLNLTLDADNFSRTMSTLVEAQFVPYKKLDTGNTYQTPKELLFRFMESLSKKLLEQRDFLGYLTILRENIKNHEILIASRNEKTDWFLSSLGTTDISWKGNKSNWIYPLFTSLSGNKSDRYMERTFELKSEAFSGCTMINHVRLHSEHRITLDEQLKTRKILYDFNILDPVAQERLLFIEWNGPNRQYIRFILPPGSKLVASSNQTASQEPDTRDYSNISLLVETLPMQNSTVGFDYTSTPANCKPGLEFHKQPGLQNYQVN